MHTPRLITACTLAIALAGCSKPAPGKKILGGPLTAAAATLVKGAAPSPAPAPAAPALPATKRVELEIGTAAGTMAFDKTTLTVPAGSEVHLVVKNAKPGLLAHNWVLVNPGTEAAVAASGLSVGPAGNYITPGPDVLAFTPLAQPGSSSEVTFNAPPPGTYPYICSFPGHYMMMKGTLTVTP